MENSENVETHFKSSDPISTHQLAFTISPMKHKEKITTNGIKVNSALEFLKVFDSKLTVICCMFTSLDQNKQEFCDIFYIVCFSWAEEVQCLTIFLVQRLSFVCYLQNVCQLC